MKKMTTLFLSSIIALSFSLLSLGCAEHKAMEPMGKNTETMHTMPDQAPAMGTMQDQGMKKEMPAPMEEKKM